MSHTLRKAACHCAIAVGLASCEDREESRHAKDAGAEVQPSKRKFKADSMTTSGFSGPVGLLKGNLQLAKVTPIADIRDAIVGCSDSAGIPFGNGLCQVYISACEGVSDAEAERIARILSGTVDGKPALLISALAASPQGKLRKELVAAALGGYTDCSKTPPCHQSYPLDEIYEVMPESGDRTKIALFRLQTAYRSKGPAAALSLIDLSESIDERKYLIRDFALSIDNSRQSGAQATSEDVALFLKKARESGFGARYDYLERKEP